MPGVKQYPSGKIRFQAMARWQGLKFHLGMFDTYREAQEAEVEFRRTHVTPPRGKWRREISELIGEDNYRLLRKHGFQVTRRKEIR